MASITPRVAVSALFALDGAVLGGWMSHIPDAQRQHGLSPGGLGLVLLGSSAGALSTMWLTGTLIHRYGSRRVSVVTGAFLLAVVPLLLRAPSVFALVATLFVMGATNGTLDVAMNAHSMAVQDRLDRPILSSVHGWFCVGGFLGSLGTALASARGFVPEEHLLAASFVLAAVLLILAPRLLPAEADRGEEGARFVLPHGRLLAIGLLTLVAFLSEGVLWDWSAVYLRSELRAGPSVAALGFGAGAGAMALGRLVGDHAIARWGPEKALRFSGLLASGGILLGVASPVLPGALLGFTLAGLGLANAVPIFSGRRRASPASRRARG